MFDPQDVADEARADWLDSREDYVDDYDHYVQECEDFDLDPMSPLSEIILENLRWDFVPEFNPPYTDEDIPF